MQALCTPSAEYFSGYSVLIRYLSLLCILLSILIRYPVAPSIAVTSFISRLPTDFNPFSILINYPGVPLGRSTGPLDVSIHALLAECDSCVFQHQAKWVSFNPRTPCGVRHIIDAGPNGFRGFQSTHSLRSATFRQQKDVAQIAVSIHALLAECDCARPYTLLLNKANHTLRQPP